MNLLLLIATCAPMVSPQVMKAVVIEESRGHPYAIHAAGSSHFPETKDKAVRLASKLLKEGVRIDAGLAQINSENWEWLGLSVETVFEPCINVRAGERVLLAGYVTHPFTKEAALSRYNTGHRDRGVRNGYVNRVFSRIENSEKPEREVKDIEISVSANSEPTGDTSGPSKIRKSFYFETVKDGFNRN